MGTAMSAGLKDSSRQRAAGAVPVLMFHSIGTGAAPGFSRFTVDPGEFSAQMDYLAGAGYRPVTASELASSRSAGQPLPPRTVVLTFDDGFTDFETTALPVLREHGYPATLYVPTGYAGTRARWLAPCGAGDREVLSWRALRDIAVEGIEVGARSHTHPQLDRVPAALLREEVYRSRCLLQDNLAVEVDGFAYPFGYWNRVARAAVATAGFGYACAVAELATAPGDDPLTLPRLTVNAGIGVSGLERLLGARPTTGARRAAAVKRITWRTLRTGTRAASGDPGGAGGAGEGCSRDG